MLCFLSISAVVVVGGGGRGAARQSVPRAEYDGRVFRSGRRGARAMLGNGITDAVTRRRAIQLRVTTCGWARDARPSGDRCTWRVSGGKGGAARSDDARTTGRGREVRARRSREKSPGAQPSSSSSSSTTDFAGAVRPAKKYQTKYFLPDEPAGPPAIPLNTFRLPYRAITVFGYRKRPRGMDISPSFCPPTPLFQSFPRQRFFNLFFPSFFFFFYFLDHWVRFGKTVNSTAGVRFRSRPLDFDFDLVVPVVPIEILAGH